MPTVEVIIKSATPKKSGETNGRKWTIYEVVADTQTGSQTFQTFDSAWMILSGDKLAVEYTTKIKDGYVNHWLGDAPTKVTPTPAVAPPVAPSKNGTDDKFGQLIHRLDMIYELLKEIRGKFA